MTKQWLMILTLGVGLFGSASLAQAAKRMPTPSQCKGKTWNKANFSHAIYNRLLRKYVRNGKVHYNGFRKERQQLDRYLCRLAHTKVKAIKGWRARFAYWINAYNAVTIRAVLDRLPKSRAAQKNFSVAAKKWNFWKGFAYKVGGRWLTLDQMEHSILRPKYKDPRLHFAIVCASIGCPSLINRAYTGKNLYAMMNRGTRRYLASPQRGLRVNQAKKVVHLSKLFNWFQADFARKPYGHRLLFVAKFAPKKHRAFLRKHHKDVTVKWLPYNWKLNVR